MNEQTPLDQPEPLDRREARRQRREERLADPSRGGTWATGLILIILGGIFLMRNMGPYDIPLRNWWALFILIPAIGSFDSALRMYRHAGNQFNAAARGSFLVGVVLTLVTLAFVFDISWTFFGPILIILVGIALIFNTTFGRQE